MNASLHPATVTLTARSYGGAVLNGYGIINPVTITLPASSSRALKAKELFGQGLIAGWAELQSASPSISGAFFLLGSNQSAFDGAAINTAPAKRSDFSKSDNGSASRKSTCPDQYRQSPDWVDENFGFREQR